MLQLPLGNMTDRAFVYLVYIVVNILVFLKYALISILLYRLKHKILLGFKAAKIFLEPI